MAVTNKWLGQAFLKAFNKEIDFLADTIKVTLHNSTYSPAQDTDDYANDATNELTTANGYTAGGATMANKVNDYTAGTNVNKFSGDDSVWTASGTLTARTAVVSDTTPGTAATNPLMTYHQSDADISATDAAWTFDIPAGGFATITPS
jgi:hypothetical protein